jgi:hypothetical protein
MWTDTRGKTASISLPEEYIFWDTMPCNLVIRPPLVWKNSPHLLLCILNHYAHEHSGTETATDELWEIITITEPYFFFPPNLINLFEAYLMLLSLTQTIWHRIIGEY